MQLLQKYHPAVQHHYAYHSKNEFVRIAVVGGDATVHNAVMGYVYVLKHHPELLENIDLQFYLLPTGSRNQLASFLAQHDSWYQASAFSAALSKLPVVPHLRPSEHNEGSWQAAEPAPPPAEVTGSGRKSIFHAALGDATRRLSKSAIASSKVKTAEEEGFSRKVAPCEVMSRVVAGYLREAQEKLQVSIFICEAWAAVGRKTYHYNIPFCCRVEVGLPAHMVSQGAVKSTNSISHKSQSGSGGLPRAACLKEGIDFETVANRFALKATLTLNRKCLGDTESSSSTVLAPSQGFSSIVINNIPRIGDSARIVDPSTDALDANIVEADWASRMRRRVQCMDDFHDAPRALCGQIQVETVREKPFDITIDGQVYGPFFRIKLSPCQAGHSSEGTLAKFPVMHNLPLKT